MPGTKIEFKLDGIAHQLEDRELAVPIYQRSYSWLEAEQLVDFWNDLKEPLLAGDAEYFLGTVVLSQSGDEGRLVVIDGQQRLATTSILLAAIRDEYKARGDETRAEIVQHDYLARANLQSVEPNPRLRLNSDDDPYYRKVVIGGASIGTVEQLHESHRLIGEALTFLRAQIHEHANAAGTEWQERLMKWAAFLKERVKVGVVEVPTEADAFVIFETLNDRGADLTIADLLKNYLFGRAGSQLESVRDSWLRALGALEMSAETATFTTFLRHYWSSLHGATRERDLYKSIRKRVTTEVNAVEFGENLEKAARLYAGLLNSEHEFWTGFGSSAKHNVDTLIRLDLEQNRPLLLAVMQHFSQSEVKRALRTMVSWAVRGIIFGGIGGGTAEKTYCGAAQAVRAGDVKSTEDLAKELQPIIPSDTEFEKSFSTTRVARAPLARYYLSALERHRAGAPEPELVPNENEEQVNLEHVLPRNPDAADWPAFPPLELKDWIYRFGNMTLLKKGPNDKIGNKPFSVKKPILEASELLLTKEAGAESDWTPSAIQARQEKLAKEAVDVWPRDPQV